MRTPQMIPTLLAILLCADASTGRDSADNVIVTLVPETSAVTQYDPLLLKIVIENRGSEAIAVPLPDRQAGSLVFFTEVKPGSGLLDVANEGGEFVGLFEVPDVEIPPGKTLVTYDRLFRHSDGDFVFRKEGSYKVVVGLGRAHRPTFKSEPVRVSVRSRKKSDLRLIDDNAALLMQALLPRESYLNNTTSSGIVDRRTVREKMAAIDRIRTQLEPCQLASTLAFRMKLLQTKYTEEHDEESTKKSLREMCEDLHGRNNVAHSIVVLLAARVAVDAGNTAEARAFLAMLKEDSLERQELLRRIRDMEVVPAISD